MDGLPDGSWNRPSRPGALPRPSPRARRRWTLAQGVSLTAALGLVVALFADPRLGLYLTWGVVVPLLPALLLVAPTAWRNLCPIGVLHQLPRRLGRGGRRTLGPSAQALAPVLAMVVLFLLVPLRHVVLNQGGPATALLILGVAGGALLGGMVFAGKSGWCSTLCPMAPVERLYGLDPVIPVPHVHCRGCIRCSDPCVDRTGGPALIRLAGGGDEGRGSAVPPRLWRTPGGVFAAAFPGFVLGFFQVDPGGTVALLYLQIALFAVGSFLLLAGGQALLGYGVPRALRLSAALAAGLYYWFTLPAAALAAEGILGAALPVPALIPGAQGGILVLLGVWLLRGPVGVAGRATRPRSLPVLGSRSAG